MQSVLRSPIREVFRSALAADGVPPPVIADWVAGSNTTLSIADNKARCTKNGTDNPRISRAVTGLVGGSQYSVQSSVFKGTASGSVFFRVHATESALRNSPYLVNAQFTEDSPVSQTFTAPANGACFIGIVPVCDTNGQYAETDETFTLTKL